MLLSRVWEKYIVEERRMGSWDLPVWYPSDILHMKVSGIKDLKASQPGFMVRWQLDFMPGIFTGVQKLQD